MVANELASEVCSLVDGVDGLIDFFMHYVVVEGSRISLNFNLLLNGTV